MPSSPEFVLNTESARVGILATDPLRSIGLQSILEEGLKLKVAILTEGSRGRAFRPDLVIVDDEVGDEAISAVTRSRALLGMPGIAVVVLVRESNGAAMQRARSAGARAVLPETAEVPEIRACIRAGLRGKTWKPRETGAAAQTGQAQADTPVRGLTHRLTPKEREVMHSLTQGRSNRQIAATMGIDEATVKAHLGRMLRKADASNRVELMLRAMEERRQGI